MAIIEYGPLASRVAGSIGGTCFQRAGTSDVVRRKPLPARPGRSLQRAQQARMGAAALLWNGASDGTKSAYGAWGVSVERTNSMGQIYSPNAQQAFVACWQVWTACGLAWTGVAPSQAGEAPEHVPTFEMSGPSLVLQSTSPGAGDLKGLAVSVYYADSKRARNRMPTQHQVGLNLSSVSLPYILGDVETGGFVTATRRRVFVHMRFVDTYGRPSKLYKYFYDIP